MSAKDYGLSETDRRGLLMDGLSRAAAGLPELAQGADALDLVSDLEPLPPLAPGFWKMVADLFALPVMTMAGASRLQER